MLYSRLFAQSGERRAIPAAFRWEDGRLQQSRRFGELNSIRSVQDENALTGRQELSMIPN
jgi:hypothetical protein